MTIFAVYLVKCDYYSDRKESKTDVADWNLSVQRATDDDCILTIAVLLI